MFLPHPATAIAVGALSTITMDLGALLGSRVGIAGGGPRRTGPDLLGRWVGHIARGRFRHSDILQAAPMPGELPLGFATHFSIGIVLALVYLWGLTAAGVSSTLLTGLLYGAATTIFAWFLMFPAQGMGWRGAAAPAPTRLARFSLYNHLIFGLGLALWTAILHPMA